MNYLTSLNKVCSGNNIPSKLIGTTCGARQQTIRRAAPALCYSAADYACPVWERSTHAKKVDTALNACCRQITGCLRPTPADYYLYIVTGIAPPDIRRQVASMRSRKSFLSSVDPLSTSPASKSVALWEERISNAPTATSMALKP